MALEYATNNQLPNQDFRRILFMKELQLLSLIGENYRKRAEIAIDETLEVTPYNDSI